MSGTSRIGGYGGYSDTGGQHGRSAALVRFMRGRKQGDVVSGVFLRMETDSLGWALLEGEELLAHLPAEWGSDGAGPSPGDRVFFRVESLVPEVLLRMLPPGDPQALLSAILPSVPLAQEAVLYVMARDKLDVFLSASPIWRNLTFSTPDPNARKAAFINCAAEDEDMLETFAEALARSRSILRAAASAGLLFFRHMPWLAPGLSQVEVSLWRDKDTPVMAGARLSSGETLFLRGGMRDGEFRYRISIAGQGTLAGKFTSGNVVAAEYSPLAKGTPGGQIPDLVGRILALAADSGSTVVGRFFRKL